MFNRKNSNQNLDTYVEERLSEYLDGTLSDKDRAIVEAQLATSAHARESLESLRYTVNLLKQTPAPTMPRQFTLPVTSRAPAQGTPPWLVWGLRGVAVAATAAFVILLTATLLRQTNQPQSTNARAAVQPSGVVALGPTSAPYGAAPQQDSANTAQPTVGAQLMITVEAQNSPELFPITETPPAIMASKAAPIDQEPPTPESLPSPLLQEEPTSPPSTQAPQPTSAPAVTDSDANAAGSSAAAAESLPATAAPTNEPPPAAPNAFPTASSQAPTQRTTSLQIAEGVVNVPQLRVRRGPGMEYRAIGGLTQGDRVRIVGRDKDTLWLQIEYLRNGITEPGWVGSTYLDVDVPLRLFRVVEPPPVLEPTATPTETLLPGILETGTPESELTQEPTLEPTPTSAPGDPPPSG